MSLLLANRAVQKVIGGVIPTDGLIAQWLLNNNVLDTSGNGWNGTAFGITYGTNRHGVSNSAAVFDPSSYVVAGNLGLSGDVTATFSLWFKASSFFVGGLFSIGNGSNLLEAMIAYGGAGGDVGALSCEFAGGNGYRCAASQYTLNSWNHYLITKTSGAINTTTHIYLNNVEIFAVTSSVNTPNVALVSSYISGFVANTFTGLLDDIRVYDRVLTSEEITELYNE